MRSIGTGSPCSSVTMYSSMIDCGGRLRISSTDANPIDASAASLAYTIRPARSRIVTASASDPMIARIR